MEDVLQVYQRPYDPANPVVCLDEASKQLIGEVAIPLPAEPGRPARIDYEYERKGTCNLFMMCEPLRGWRHVRVTERRTRRDWAECIKELVDVHYPVAAKVRLVLDNLNTHSGASLYEAFPPGEARRLLDRLEIHPTPQARELAGHGRDRAADHESAMPGPADRGRRRGPARGRDPGEGSESEGLSDPLDVHSRRRSAETEDALPVNRRLTAH